MVFVKYEAEDVAPAPAPVMALSVPSSYRPHSRETREEARRRLLIERNIPLAEYWAAKLFRRDMASKVPRDDVRAAALEGLVRAANRFNPSRGFLFATFAVPTISGEIKRLYRDEAELIKRPRWVTENFPAVHKAASMIAATENRRATDEEIAEITGIRVDVVQMCRRQINLVSLEARIDETGASGGIGGSYQGSRSGTVEDVVGDVDPRIREIEGADGIIASGDLVEALAGLPEKERHVITLRYVNELSQQETADRIGHSQMQVCRLQQRGLSRLRQSLTPAGSPA